MKKVVKTPEQEKRDELVMLMVRRKDVLTAAVKETEACYLQEAKSTRTQHQALPTVSGM